jgi:hypothetical protein
MSSGGVGPPWRSPCLGWRTPTSGACYRHQRASEKAVPGWIQSTKVNDWMCPPGGTIPESCNADQACSQPTNVVSSFSVFAKGSGYHVSDALTVVGGTGTSAQATVATIDGTGGVKTVTLANAGLYTVDPTTPNSVSGGLGTGCQLGLVFSNRLWSSTGILPYPRLSDSGGGGTCGGPNRCDTIWPASTTGNCPGPCASGCGNRGGEPKCDTWVTGNLADNPSDWIACHSVDTTHKTVGFNCFISSGKNVDMSLCRKIGFKNIQVWKSWHGKFSYRSHDPSGLTDLGKQVGFGSATCAGGGSLPSECNGLDIEFEQTTPDTNHYLTETVTCSFVAAGGSNPGSGSVSRSASIDRYSGVMTRACSGGGSGADIWTQEAHDLLFNGFSDVSCPSVTCGDTYCPPPAGMLVNKNQSLSLFYRIVLEVACVNVPCAYDITIVKSGSSLTFTSYYAGTGNIYKIATVDTSTGNFSYNRYDGGGVLQWHEYITYSSDTAYTHGANGIGMGSFGSSTVTITVTGSLTVPYTSADVNADWITLRKKWNLSDDLQYPWRADEHCNVAPIVHYSEPMGGVAPAIGECWADYPTNTVPWVDGNSLLYDGSIKGAPVPFDGLDRGYFDFNHVTWRACCGDSSTVGSYRYAYGAFAGETNATDPTDAGIPKTATEWTENYNAFTGVSCGTPPCADGYPFGPGTGYSGLAIPIPCIGAPGSLPYGQWKYFWNGVLIGQEWAEIKVPRPSVNFDRPCGADRYDLDETTVRCIQASSSGIASVDINSATAINTADLVWVCGSSVVPTGLYQATKNSSTNYTLVLKDFAPGYVYPLDCNSFGGNGIMGKLRFPSAPGICGRVSVINAYSTVIGGVTKTEITTGNATQLAKGDSVVISGVSGIDVNATFTVDSTIDSSHFVINHSPTGTFSGPGFVAVNGAPDYWWDDDQSKGQFAYVVWLFNLRDYQERQRVVDQYAATGSCADAAPASSTLIRAKQVTHGMPQAVSTFTATQECLAFDPCNPQVMAITSNGYDAITNPSGEQWPNAFVAVPATLTLDGRFGAMQQSAIIQHIQDPFWMKPHIPCVTYSTSGEGPTVCTWGEDDGSCLTDTCPDDTSGGGTRYYFREPYAENILAVPAGAPVLPTGIYIGYLSLAALDTLSPVNGNVLIPPFGPGYASPDTFNSAIPLAFDTVWGRYIRSYLCECAHGRFEADYLAQGIKVNCP